MTARRDGSRTQPSFTDGPVDCLLADSQEPCRFFRADQPSSPFAGGGERFSILGQEAAVPSRGDGGGLEQPPRHSAKDGRPADAKAGG